MTKPFNATKISDSVYWVGAIDWGIRDFHGYLTSRGTSYNAYLIMADKITLVDTVKKPFKEEMLHRIKSVIDVEKIDYIVSHHAEMDHSGLLPDMIDIIKPEKVFASEQGVKALEAHFEGIASHLTPVKTGDKVSLGNMNLAFIETKMLHWPDSMISYLDKDKIVFSQDAFGMHLASYERFVDEMPWEIVYEEMTKYYANILLLLSPLITKFINQIPSLNLDIKIIASDHGPIWRQDITKPIELYAKWAEQKPEKRALVVYDTMWGSTQKMAQAVAEGIDSTGVSTKIMKLRSSHRTDIVTELLFAGGLAVGSPTMNNNLYPTIADILTYIKGLAPKNLSACAFGSYGWSGQAVRQINEVFESMKCNIISEGYRSVYVPNDAALIECRNLGESLGNSVIESVG